jgi:hypothetical protein
MRKFIISKCKEMGKASRTSHKFTFVSTGLVCTCRDAEFNENSVGSRSARFLIVRLEAPKNADLAHTSVAQAWQVSRPPTDRSIDRRKQNPREKIGARRVSSFPFLQSRGLLTRDQDY